MIEKTLKLYTMSELKEQFPKGFQRAFENHYTQTFDFWGDIDGDLDRYFEDALKTHIGEDMETFLINWKVDTRSLNSQAVEYITFILDFYNDYYFKLARDMGLSEDQIILLENVLQETDIIIGKHSRYGEYDVYFRDYSSDILEELEDRLGDNLIDNMGITEETIDKLENDLCSELKSILSKISDDLINGLNDNIKWRNSEERTIEASESNDELYFEDGRKVE